MSVRYAIYYAPRAGTPLWDKASAWLGRDAYTGELLQRPALPGLADLDLDALTADPRGYGFHATLKAPFELADGFTDTDLLNAVRALSEDLEPFDTPVAPAALGKFLAFRLPSPSPRIEALHARCVRELDAFRAPMSDFDLARRRKADLTSEQDVRLVAWGYPYLFEDFRFHMTLTSRIADDEVRQRLLAALTEHFAPETGVHRFDGIAVFKQDDREAPFNIIERVAFGSEALVRA